MVSTASAKRPPPPKPEARKENPTNAEFEKRAKAMLRNAITQRGMTLEELAARLTEMGVPISEGGLANKISRGGFSAAFLLQCMEAMEINVAALQR